jgi:dipeptidyl aminopeptidase/acylaminoacyl peptidase
LGARGDQGIDSERVYAVGHSSAATIALLVASQDHRVRRVVAFAPAPYPLRWISLPRRKELLDRLAAHVAGFDSFLAWTAPGAHIEELGIPALIFHSEEDTNIAIGDTAEYVTALKKINPSVTFVRAAHGGHYDSMIREGIPRAIEWLEAAKR